MAVSGSVAGSAAWFEFVGEGSAGALEGRVVVEFEQIGALTIDAAGVIVGWLAPHSTTPPARRHRSCSRTARGSSVWKTGSHSSPATAGSIPDPPCRTAPSRCSPRPTTTQRSVEAMLADRIGEVYGGDTAGDSTGPDMNGYGPATSRHVFYILYSAAYDDSGANTVQ